MFQSLVSLFIAGVMAISASVAGFFLPPPEPVNIDSLEAEIRELEAELGSVSFVAGERYRIAGGGITAAATSITLQSFQTLDGRELSMTHFGDKGWLTLEPGTSKKEFVSFTGISQNASNDEATLTGVTRGLDFISPYTASSSLRQAHSGGALVIISNPPQLYNEAAFKSNAETISGEWTFVSTSTPQYDAHPSFSTDLEIIDKKYADDLAIAGAADANTTTKGLVEIATRSDVNAAAAASSSDTTADLVVPTSYFATTTSATTSVPVTNSSGKLAQGFLDLTADWTFSGTTTLSGTTAITGALSASSTVSITGPLTVSSTTDFSASIPTIPTTTPTTDDQIASKKYVDDNDENIISATYASMSLGTIRYATTSSFIVGVCDENGAGAVTYTIRIGTSSPPGTAIITDELEANDNDAFCVPVPKGYYVQASSTSAITCTAYLFPTQ